MTTQKQRFSEFDAAFEYLQVLRNLVAHCILIDDTEDGTLFHLRSKDRTFKKSDIFESEEFTNYCAMLAMVLRYALGISNIMDRRLPLPPKVKMPYALQHYTMFVAIKSPSHCSPTEIDQFRNLVVKAGEVGTRGINNRIQSAEVLAFLTVSNKVVGIAALKNPNMNYKRGVFEKAHSVDSLSTYRFELGWCHVSEKFQGNGYSKVLLKELLPSARDQGVYATSTMDNQRMHRALESEGFVRIGDSWPSTNQPKKSLLLFVRD